MPNERLRSSIGAAGLSLADLAERVEVDPKTVERWVGTGRLPMSRLRRRSADVLGRDEAYLWPEAAHQRLRAEAPSEELVQLFPTRGAVPQDLWNGLLARAREHVDVLAYSALFMTDGNADLPMILGDRARNGAAVRLCLGAPSAPAVELRGQEEGIGEGLGGRVRLQLSYLAPLVAENGVEIRLHDTTLYNSIFRFDDEVLVNTHTYGVPAGRSPVVHLHRLDSGRLFDHYLASFEAVWSFSMSMEAAAEGGDL